MANIVLGKKPKNFKPFTVKFPMPDGTEGIIAATFKYRTRSEFGVMMNSIFADAKKKKPKAYPTSKLCSRKWETRMPIIFLRALMRGIWMQN